MDRNCVGGFIPDKQQIPGGPFGLQDAKNIMIFAWPFLGHPPSCNQSRASKAFEAVELEMSLVSPR